MKRIGLLLLLFTMLFSFSCKKKKVEDKLDGLWVVNYIVNRDGAIRSPGTMEIKENGKGAFNLNYFDIQTGKQRVDTRTFEWKNTKNTFQIEFINGDGHLYFEIRHISTKQFTIYSGDYHFAEFQMYRE